MCARVYLIVVVVVVVGLKFDHNHYSIDYSNISQS